MFFLCVRLRVRVCVGPGGEGEGAGTWAAFHLVPLKTVLSSLSDKDT